MATAVIIPARNEEATIGAIVRTFNEHPETAGRVYVGIDGATIDNTFHQVWSNGGVPIDTINRGKGQVVTFCIKQITNVGQMTGRIILCDADYSGLTTGHIDQMLGNVRGMTIGVPDWPEIDVPEYVINAWPRVSGFRHLPVDMIPDDAHGYLLETQLNIAAIKHRMPINTVWLAGLKSPFQWPLTIKRQAERDIDRNWGKQHGVL